MLNKILFTLLALLGIYLIVGYFAAKHAWISNFTFSQYDGSVFFVIVFAAFIGLFLNSNNNRPNEHLRRNWEVDTDLFNKP